MVEQVLEGGGGESKPGIRPLARNVNKTDIVDAVKCEMFKQRLPRVESCICECI